MRHRVLALKSKVREIIGKNPGPPLSSLDDIQEYIDKGIVRVPANTLSHDLTLPVTVLHRHGPVGFCWLENDTTGRYLVIASMNYEGSIPESAVHADDSGIPKPIVESIMVPLNDGLPEFNYINNIGNDKILVLALQGLPASFGRQILYNVSQSRILGINPESDMLVDIVVNNLIQEDGSMPGVTAQVAEMRGREWDLIRLLAIQGKYDDFMDRLAAQEFRPYEPG